MILSRRSALKMFGKAIPALALPSTLIHSAFGRDLQFQGTRVSLARYKVPDWFSDAKFGIWSHWGPQSAIGDGDWYARNMYVEGSPQYEYHKRRFGPQSRFGYKDTVPLFTANRWDPDQLIELYVKAGAKYFFSMGVHHDNYDLWDSKFQPHWNSVKTGPRKDIVGLWATAARKRGLRFGVSEHLSNSFDWFAPSHLSDSQGSYKGIPYDGADPAYASIYHDYSGEPADFAKTAQPMGRVAPARWKAHYLDRIRDLVDQHKPDCLYTDGGIPFEEYGLKTVAELYNVGPKDASGHPATVYFSKTATDCAVGTCVLDRERGVSDDIWPSAWQTDTCIGDWHYKSGQEYKSSKKVIDLLVDIVSKNGNLLLNFPLPASGELDKEEMKVIEGITSWMSVNSEGIYSSRPWRVYGEGPAMKVVVPSTGFNESKKPDLGAKDIRFTVRGETLYAFVQGWPEDHVAIQSLGRGSQLAGKPVKDVRMLGRDTPLKFSQDSESLKVTLPPERPRTADIGIGLRIRFS